MPEKRTIAVNGNELKEALGAAGVGALIPKIIDPQLLEYQRRYSPLVRSIPSGRWDSDVYYFNRRTRNPRGGHVQDGGARPLTASTYEQYAFQMTHLQTVGGVTGYAQAVTRQVIGDLRAREIEGSIQGLYWDMETSVLWGNAAATVNGAYPQFDGLDSLVGNFSGAEQNAQDKGGASLSLAHLDELADMVETNAAMSVFDSQWMFVMSNTAQSRMSQLLQAQQRFEGPIEVAAGLIVPSYRGIPIVKSSFLSTRTYTMGTVTQASASTGGTLAAGTYNYRISAVMERQGEIAASAAVTTAALTGATNTVTLSFAVPGGLEGAQPLLYKVYRSTSPGTETLLGVVDAVVGFAADGKTPIMATSIVDNGATLIPKAGATAPAQPTPVYVGGNVNRFPPATGNESIYLVSRDRENLYRPYVRELEPLDVFPTTDSPDTLPYAIVADTTLALRAPKYLGVINRVNTQL
ncbi:Hypothetical protein AJAP_42440 (plasmid) [Amycolatopsis japonica]|uniref:Uncharacterized protein n=1 Tax=Amycolatopsis japonica TaxID=208439 RepID=A0A075V9Q0_9PSEU|nr:hypothetical protein [Amycolatopsis japonica]AIG81259.1 Hypothetical protein AJAP_42440 [Amycolatopsis japonica]